MFSFDFEKEWKGRSLGMKIVKTSDIYAIWDLALDGCYKSYLDPSFKVHSYIK